MKIAVTYQDGAVFQHFGKTESFKVYDVAYGMVTGSEVIGTDGAGHEALVDFLAGKGVEVVICGGLGNGALNALNAAGIKVVSGAAGEADAALEAYLAGDLESTGANCGHHDREEEESGCGGNCGGCHGCHSVPDIEGPNVGKTCRTHYRGTFNDGTEFDSSYGRGEPLEFVCGAGQMIRGFDEAVAVMEVGQSVDIHLTPDQAYGEVNPEAIFALPIAQLPGSEELNVGERVVLYDSYGRPVPVAVVGKDETTITFDANHEMAGKELNFHIELVEAN